MNTLAFDLATRSAWAKVAIREHRGPADPDYIVLQFGTIDIGGYVSRPIALSHFYHGVMLAVHHATPIDSITYERVPATWRGVKQVGMQHEQYGVFLLALAEMYHAESVISFSPSEWQMPLLGIRSNTKLLKAHAITQARLRAGFETTDTDLADAVNIAIWGLIRARQLAAIEASV